MPTAATLVTYLLACFVLAVVPGPTVTVVVANALAHGARAGLMNIVGAQLGLLSMIGVIAFGFDTVVALAGEVFGFIKLLGAAYLIWLGATMLLARRNRIATARAGGPRSNLQYALQGFGVVWSNPKALLFLGAFLPQFVDPAAPPFGQIILLGLIFFAVAGTTDSMYALAAGRTRNLFAAARLTALNRFAGALLVGGGIWLALEKRI